MQKKFAKLLLKFCDFHIRYFRIYKVGFRMGCKISALQNYDYYNFCLSTLDSCNDSVCKEIRYYMSADFNMIIVFTLRTAKVCYLANKRD